jgi:hypothetical protein
MVLIMMRRYIECGDTSYDVSPPAGPPCIAAFLIYQFAALLSLQYKNIIKAEDEEAYDNLYLWHSGLGT